MAVRKNCAATSATKHLCRSPGGSAARHCAFITREVFCCLNAKAFLLLMRLAACVWQEGTQEEEHAAGGAIGLIPADMNLGRRRPAITAERINALSLDSFMRPVHEKSEEVRQMLLSVIQDNFLFQHFDSEQLHACGVL